MKDEFSFNITKLTEVIKDLNKYYQGYRESLTNLEQEIKKLESLWGTSDKSLYNVFKDKYHEKSPKLKEVDEMIKSLLNDLTIKNEELQSTTDIVMNNFE